MFRAKEVRVRCSDGSKDVTLVRMTMLFIVLRVFSWRMSSQLLWTVFPQSTAAQGYSPPPLTYWDLSPAQVPSLNSKRVRKASGNLGRCVISPYSMLATLHITVGLLRSLGCIPAGCFCLSVLWQERATLGGQMLLSQPHFPVLALVLWIWILHCSGCHFVPTNHLLVNCLSQIASQVIIHQH